MSEKQTATRLLSALENGGMSEADTVFLGEDLDPVLIYVIVSFLRAVYPASDPAATAVLGRVVAFISASPRLSARYREGGQDPVSRWFEEEHGYSPFLHRGGELVELVVDKLES